MVILRSNAPRIVLALALSLAPVIACAHRTPADVQPVSRTSTRSAHLRAQNDDAVMRITTRRCEHELACERIGIGRPHGDMATCLETTGREIHRDLDAACPSGVEESAVVRCLADLATDPCGGILDASATPASCGREITCWRSR